MTARLAPVLMAGAMFWACGPAAAQEAASPAAPTKPAAPAAAVPTTAEAPVEPPLAPIPNDLLNAALWQQVSVEAKANAIAIYALGRMRLDAALADKSASALDQKDAGDKPVAVILDLDETVLDNSAYESGLVTTDANYSSKTWDAWTKAEDAKAVPGSLDYVKYADGKGVKIFYVTNREASQEDATRANMQALGYPMGGDVDTFLMNGEKPDWKSDKTPRRDFVAKDYRVVQMFGDNFNDFTAEARGTPAERLAAFQETPEPFFDGLVHAGEPDLRLLGIGDLRQQLPPAKRRKTRHEDQCAGALDTRRSGSVFRQMIIPSNTA